jgi:hypothetical protein
VRAAAHSAGFASEDDLQIAAIKALSYLPAPAWVADAWSHTLNPRATVADLVYHTPNGGGRSKREAGRFKAMGVQRGIPDLITAVPVAPYVGAALELKQPGNYPTPNQRAELQYRHQLGHAVGWADDLEAIVTFWRRYFAGELVNPNYLMRFSP